MPGIPYVVGYLLRKRSPLPLLKERGGLGALEVFFGGIEDLGVLGRLASPGCGLSEGDSGGGGVLEGASIQIDDVFGVDHGGGALGAGVFVGPAFDVEASFHIDRTALLQFGGAAVAQVSEDGDIEKLRLLLLGTVFASVVAIHSEANAADLASGFRTT